jgi:uncharacterized protein
VNIAVVGSGISGLVCAYLLSGTHRVTLFEADDRLGGHTHTSLVTHEGRQFHVDSGFIVFNERNYPSFTRLLERLRVPSRPTTMSFSVRDPRDGFEYGGASLPGLVGAWTNPLRPRWWSVVRGVARLGSRGKAALAHDDDTIADLAARAGFSDHFLGDYLLPMACAIWSAPADQIMRFPARFLLRFFNNHGMLDLRERPTWRTVVGGSHAYVNAMMPILAPALRLRDPVRSIRRQPDAVLLTAASGEHRFDQVILALHADQALSLLADASPAEHDTLAAMPFQANLATLHTDSTLLPRRRRCWAAWNYLKTEDPARPAIVTYNMSILQGLPTREPLCVTLNAEDRIHPARVLRRFTYAHPLYSTAGERARARWSEISGVRRTHFCGAYWGNGFHEDGVASALRVCQQWGASI